MESGDTIIGNEILEQPIGSIWYATLHRMHKYTVIRTGSNHYPLLIIFGIDGDRRWANFNAINYYTWEYIGDISQ